MKNFLFLSLAFACFGCRNTTNIHTVEVIPDSIKLKMASLTNQNDSLIKLAGEMNTNYWFDPEMVGDVFSSKRIDDPTAFIDSSLRYNSKLIPMEGVLGGTMRFDSIQILSTKWLIANYSDGHIIGTSIYSYRLLKGRKIEFRLIASVEDE